MNKKIVLIFAILTIGIVSIYFLQAMQSSNLQNIILLPLIKGCAETDSGMTTKTFVNGTEQEPKIEVIGNEIIYSSALNHLCCRKVEIEKGTSDSVINIYEVWTGIGCKCICFSEIEAKIKNVPPGTYMINVYEKGIKPGGTNEPMEEKLIISEQVTVQ